ncbi:short-chain dehydrogenase [Diplodia corticola]|uniref:Short-chain dehydrogenase n=1 Tax=Diplodia corticola TaxID=236234 RepID=A0A1J9QTG2_9PEZI|nr:short-chain dehydrogenase [Diplodia corticola]OJD31681.1 short-chain dehydrogenase [Diplodia corticola]
MPNRLAGKTAIITGASSGLGRAIALAYAQEGARVACVDLFPTLRDERDPVTGKARLLTERLTASSAAVPTHELLRQKHPASDAIFVQADLTVAADVERAVARVVEAFGRLDIMVNNAGISVESSHPRVLRCHETPEADYDKTMAINTKGVFLGCKYALAQMLSQEPLEGQNDDKGWVINTASIQGLLAYHGTPAYCASKGAVVQLTKQIALDYAKDRVHCNCICPGFLRTAMTANHQSSPAAQAKVDAAHPFGGMGEPEDAARAAVFLASDDVRWITGQPIVVDGGYSIQ